MSPNLYIFMLLPDLGDDDGVCLPDPMHVLID